MSWQAPAGCSFIALVSAYPVSVLYGLKGHGSANAEGRGMAMPRTGARGIVVDGVAYRWRVRRRAHRRSAPNQDGRVHVSVELVTQAGSLLVVFTGHEHPQDADTSPPINPVLPAHVAAWIRHALLAGWRPADKGAQFHVRQQQGGLVERCS